MAARFVCLALGEDDDLAQCSALFELQERLGGIFELERCPDLWPQGTAFEVRQQRIPLARGVAGTGPGICAPANTNDRDVVQ